MNNSISQIFVGVDVSKNSLDVHIYPVNKAFTVANSKKGIREMKRKLARYCVGQIVCEATGGYEILLTTQLNDYNLWVVEPKRMKAFIMSENMNAKTDKIDARMIALFAAQKTPQYTSKHLSKDEAHIKALNQRRLDLIEMLNKETNRIQHPAQIHCKTELKKHIAFLKKQLTKINAEIERLINANDVLQEKNVIIQSIPGVGKVAASMLISFMPELGTITDKQIAALAGVAPFDRQSGSHRRKSIIKGGRSEIRKVLYMAALVASRFNPVMKAFYERLINVGKKPKVVLVAIIRKLIVILNVMIRKGEMWQPQ